MPNATGPGNPGRNAKTGPYRAAAAATIAGLRQKRFSPSAARLSCGRTPEQSPEPAMAIAIAQRPEIGGQTK